MTVKEIVINLMNVVVVVVFVFNVTDSTCFSPAYFCFCS